MTEQLYPWGRGTPTWLLDDTANDSDKSFTVPAGKRWDMLSSYQKFATTATVGDRRITLVVTDGTDEIARTQVVAVQAASAFNYYNLSFAGCTEDLAIGSGSTKIGGVQELILEAGYVIRVYDIAVVDPAADDLTVVLHYTEYDVS